LPDIEESPDVSWQTKLGRSGVDDGLEMTDTVLKGEAGEADDNNGDTDADDDAT